MAQAPGQPGQPGPPGQGEGQPNPNQQSMAQQMAQLTGEDGMMGRDPQTQDGQPSDQGTSTDSSGDPSLWGAGTSTTFVPGLGTKHGRDRIDIDKNRDGFRVKLSDKELKAVRSASEDKLPANRRDADILRRYFSIFETAGDEAKKE
jgi:hypothetical protein